MSLPASKVSKFIKYIVLYPDVDEEGYDGIHNGGWKGLSDDAPEEAKAQYEEYLKLEAEALKTHSKL